MKKVFISGCSSGIGKSLAYTYSKKGYTVGLGSRNMVALNLVKKECEEIGGCVFIYRLDVRDHKNCSLVASRFQLDAGGIDFVIANAGIGGHDDLFSGKSFEINNILKTNLLGMTNVLMPFIPFMKKERKGTLVCISSVAGFIPTPHHGGYSSSKVAIRMIFDSWRPTLKKFNIKTVTICPGFIDTPMVTGLGKSFPMKSSNQASQKFVEIIEKGTPTFIYPWPYRFLIWIYYITPKSLYNFLILKIFNKPISKKINNIEA
ncbi:MAG: SDR family NAD(P)-dependent oxidoreductase [Fidelibacterota bacterium]|jgi:short-subunit dehydrogenase|tara:strand:- start:146 stop:928 length:783 start_codon:yes stop_codon:yes gene_type:complete